MYLFTLSHLLATLASSLTLNFPSPNISQPCPNPAFAIFVTSEKSVHLLIYLLLQLLLFLLFTLNWTTVTLSSSICPIPNLINFNLY